MGFSTVFAATALAATTAHAGGIPTVGFERYEMANGLEVILHQDRAVPLVAVDVWYHVGSGDETPGKSGFAHLFEHMMFQGAKHIGEDVHFDILRKVGASGVNGTTNSDRTNYFEVVPSHQVETALWLESDRMGYLLDVLNEESLRNQIDVVRNERRQRYDNVPYGQDRFAVASVLYPEKHPYRYLTIGRHEDLESASISDVRDFFLAWYVPSNATLLMAGDFEIDDAKQLVEKWFGSFPKIAEPKRRDVATPKLSKTVRREIEDSFARFPRLHYAWHSPANLAEGDAELDILSDVLGASGWGRLYKVLVVETKLAQRVSAYQHGSNRSGEFHVVVDLKPKADRAEAERLLRRELDELVAKPPSEAEIRRSINRREASFVWGLEELLSRAEHLQYFNHYTGKPGYASTYLETLRSRSPADVRKVAKSVLGKPRAEVVTLPGKKAKVEK